MRKAGLLSFILMLVLLLSVYLLFFSLPALADIAFVKNIGTNQIKGAGTSISITVPAAGVKGGNSIIVTFAMDSYTGSVSVSDSKGNTLYLTINDTMCENGAAVRNHLGRERP